MEMILKFICVVLFFQTCNLITEPTFVFIQMKRRVSKSFWILIKPSELNSKNGWKNRKMMEAMRQ